MARRNATKYTGKLGTGDDRSAVPGFLNQTESTTPIWSFFRVVSSET
jgi:hypothetical protein